MNIKTKAFVEIAGSVVAGAVLMFTLMAITPKYALIIFVSLWLAYFMYSAYKFRVQTLEMEQYRKESEQSDIVNILKK